MVVLKLLILLPIFSNLISSKSLSLQTKALSSSTLDNSYWNFSSSIIFNFGTFSISDVIWLFKLLILSLNKSLLKHLLSISFLKVISSLNWSLALSLKLWYRVTVFLYFSSRTFWKNNSQIKKLKNKVWTYYIRSKWLCEDNFKWMCLKPTIF